MAAIARVVHFDQELLDFVLKVDAPVIDARRFPERGPHVIDRQAVADAGAEERRRLVTGRLRECLHPTGTAR